MTDYDGPEGCSCKVGTVAAAHGLADIHERFRDRWRGDASVRDLTDRFNRRVLRAALERAGHVPVEGEVDNLYRVLTADDVDAGSRTRVREQLRHDGVTVEDLERQFISHQTLYRHLTDCLGVEHESPYADADERVDAWHERIRSLRNRTAAVTERGVDRLSAHDAVDVGSADVFVDIVLACDDCGEFYDIEEFLEGRGCDCASDSPG